MLLESINMYYKKYSLCLSTNFQKRLCSLPLNQIFKTYGQVTVYDIQIALNLSTNSMASYQSALASLCILRMTVCT